MKKITFLLCILLLFYYIKSFSQNQDIAYPHVVPMSPNAAELAKYSDTPISYYTGTPNISIPLYEIDVDDFKLPITLNYHASGIRVDQEASWVGLGWSLDVGSRISRTIKSADDFQNGGFDRNFSHVRKGYYRAPDISTNRDNDYEIIGVDDCWGGLGSPSRHLIYDPEPDVFYYKLPNMNGKFILDKSRGAVLFDKSHNLKIEVIGNQTSVTFKIIDAEGNQYFYNKWETTKNYTSNGWLNKNVHNNNTIYDDDISDFIEWIPIRNRTNCETDFEASLQSPNSMITSWCLSKIITKNSREINFTYDSENQYLPTQESCEKYNYNAPIGSDNYSGRLYYQKSKVVNRGLRLKTIEGDFGRVEFNASDRHDMETSYYKSKKLESFSIYNNTNTLIKSYKFDYSYFNDNYNGDYQYEHVFKRLKLNKVTEYKSNEFNLLNNGHTFNYYEGSLPAKNSKNVDYWGFQNGKNYGEKYYIGVQLSNNLSFLGSKKDANFEKAIIGTLKKITYPTGGTSEFKFESNTIHSGYFETNTVDQKSSTATANLPVFNNYISDDSVYGVYPSNDVYQFVIEGKTEIRIKCTLENVIGDRDLSYNYESNGNPLGVLRKINPSSNNLYNYVCPLVWDSPLDGGDGEGSELELVERMFTLEPGTYEFEAYSPPRDVGAFWEFNFHYLYTPGKTPGTPVTAYDAGGIRISEIKTDAKIRKFRYPIGTVLVEPVLYYIGTRNGIPNNSGCFVQVSESKTPLSTFNRGNFLGYNWVEEYIVDENDNESKIKYTYYNDSENEMFDDSFPDSPRYINYTNGLIKSIEKYKSVNQKTSLLEKEDFLYTSTYSSFINAFRDRGQRMHDDDLLSYYYEIEWPLKTKHIKTLNTDDGESIVSETNYSYNSKDLLQSTSFNLDDSEIIQELKYPFDFVDQISLGMVDKNMIGIPVEKTTLKKLGTNTPVKLSQSFTKYKAFGNNYLPEVIRTSKGSDDLEDRLLYSDYDEYGNLLEVSKENGLHIVYVWGYYNKEYPIAKIVNATFIANQTNTITSNQQTLINEAVTASVNDTTDSAENLLRNKLQLLRGGFPNSMVTTYTYDPLIGVTSITNPKGYTMYYKYDEYNRLKHVKDADSNILSKNEYNYKQ